MGALVSFVVIFMAYQNLWLTIKKEKKKSLACIISPNIKLIYSSIT